jgi:hypothetical protein
MKPGGFKDTCEACEQRIVDAQMPMLNAIEHLRGEIEAAQNRIAALQQEQWHAIEKTVLVLEAENNPPLDETEKEV